MVGGRKTGIDFLECFAHTHTQKPEQTWFGGLVFKAVAGLAGSTRGSVLSFRLSPLDPLSVVSLPPPARLTHYAYAGQA